MAARAIRHGRLVVFPTETVYGIGSNALSDEACARIFDAKGRDGRNPLIVHVSDITMAEGIAHIPLGYRRILKRVWPAPLTVVVKSLDRVSSRATAGLDTVAIRMPKHNVALALLKASALPIAAPSANISGMPSATDGKHAIRYFKGSADVIIDSGETRLGLESTVLDLHTFSILRPGAFTPEDIRVWFGKKPSFAGRRSRAASRSPGTLFKHYAPRTRLFLFSGEASSLASIIGAAGKQAVFIGSDESCAALKKCFMQTMPLGSSDDLEGVARNLFKALIDVDMLHAKFAISEFFPEKGVGVAIMDRLRRASEGSVFSDMQGMQRQMRKRLTPSMGR